MNKEASLIARCAALFNTARMVIGATSTLYLISKGISAPDVMYLKGVQAAALLVLEVPLGWCADRVGRKYPIVFGMLAGATWLALTAAAPTILWLYIAEVCNAASLALISAALQAEFIDKFSEAKTIGTEEATKLADGVSHFTRLQFQGMAAGAAIGGITYGLSPSGTWWAAAGLAFLAAAIFTFFYRPQSTRHLPGGPDKSTTAQLRLWPALRSSHKGTVVVVSVSGLLYASFQISIQYWQISLQDAGAGSGSGVATRTAVVAAAVVIPPAIWLVSLFLHLPWFLLGVEIWLYFWLYRGAMVVIDALVNVKISSEIRATVISARSTIARLITLAVSPVVSLGVKEWSASGAVSVVVCVACLSAVGIILMNTGQYFYASENSLDVAGVDPEDM